MHKLHNLVFSEYTDLGWEAKTSQSTCCFWLSNSFSSCTLAPSTGTPSQPLLEEAAKGPLQPHQAAVPQRHGWEEESCFSPVTPLWPLPISPLQELRVTALKRVQKRRERLISSGQTDACASFAGRILCYTYICLEMQPPTFYVRNYIRSFHYRNASILVNWRLQNSTIYEEENFYCLKQLSSWPTHSIFPKRTH